MASHGGKAGIEVTKMSISPEEIKRNAEIDKLLSTANVHRMRGQFIEAEDTYKQALELAPDRLDIMELVADMLQARGQLDAAAAEYRKILGHEPGRVSAETKYARVVLEIGTREQAKLIAQEMIDNPGKRTAPRNPLLAAILSVAVPGLGQLYTREFAKGAIILGAFLLSVVILALSPMETANIFNNLRALVNPVGSRGNLPVGGLVILASCVLAFIYIYAVIDAPITAAKQTEADRKAAGLLAESRPPRPKPTLEIPDIERPTSREVSAKISPPPDMLPPAEDEKLPPSEEG